MFHSLGRKDHYRMPEVCYNRRASSEHEGWCVRPRPENGWREGSQGTSPASILERQEGKNGRESESSSLCEERRWYDNENS